MTPEEEVVQLRESLSILRNSYYRTADPKYPDTVLLNRKEWVRAFAPLIAPPYNLLRWEEEWSPK